MSDEQKPNQEAIPPKVSLKKTGEIPGAVPAGIPSAPKKATARIDLPLEIGTAPTVKKTLPLAASQSAAGVIAGGQTPTVKTIRLASLPVKPAASVPGTLSSQDASPSAEDAKRQTARIPLQAALGAAGTAAPDLTVPSQPKTIRIKRPGQAPSVPSTAPIERAAPPSAPAPGLAPAEAAKKKTARVELPDGEVPAAAQPTQRKTIKLRRTEESGQPVPRSVAVARLESQMAERQAAAAQTLGVLYPILAAAALVVLLVLSYLLAAQAFPGLGWRFPGQIVG